MMILAYCLPIRASIFFFQQIQTDNVMTRTV